MNNWFPGLMGEGSGGGMGEILGGSVYREEDIDTAIENAEAEGYDPEVIRELEQYRDSSAEYREENDIDPLLSDPEIAPEDLGSGSTLPGSYPDPDEIVEGNIGGRAMLIRVLIYTIPLALLAYAFGQLFDINIG